MSYEDVKNSNTDAVALLNDPQALWREEGVQLTRAYCQAQDSLQPMNVDMDGVVIITRTFSSLNILIQHLNLKVPVRPGRSVTAKTAYKERLVWELLLSQSHEYRVALMASSDKSLTQFRRALERRLQMVSATDRNRITVVRNDLGSGFLKVNPSDALWLYTVMDASLRDLCQIFPLVCNNIDYPL